MNLTAINTLQQLAQREIDQAARALQTANQQHQASRQRLAMLVGLRADYGQRLQQACDSGVSMAAIRNFHGFIDKIDQAIAGQHQLEQSAAARAADISASWQARQRTAMIWASLRRRSEHAVLLGVQAQERRQMDEFAARSRQHAVARSGLSGESE